MRYTIINERVRGAVQTVVESLPIDNSHPYVVEIKQRATKRSLDQNALLWKWYDVIRQHVGDTTGEHYSAEQLHEWFKAKFLPSRVVSVAGESVRCRATTTKLTVAEMHDYMEMIDRYCADRLHLLLPVRPLDNDERTR